MSDYNCPWCGSGIEDLDYRRFQPKEDYAVVCGDCGREFEVKYRIDPVFFVCVPDALDECDGCGAWNILETCCEWQGSDAMAGCPLGHDKEEA